MNRRGAGLYFGTGAGGKEPDGFVIGDSLPAEQREGTWGQRDVAVLLPEVPALATAKLELHAGPVDPTD